MGTLSPFLLILLKEQQDCYSNRVDCEHDWGPTDCKKNATVPATNNCRVLGRSYRIFRGT